MLKSLFLVAALAFFAGPAFAHDGHLHDPEIAHAAYTAGAIDVKAAEQALRKSQTDSVLAFAKQMRDDHSEVNRQALALLGELKVEPKDNELSQSLAKDGETKMAALEKLDGKAFDRAYIENEIAYHKAVNTALEAKLIPESKNGKLKALLQTGLKIFRGHQQHAEHALGELK